jgi:hypothetical protein
VTGTTLVIPIARTGYNNGRDKLKQWQGQQSYDSDRDNTSYTNCKDEL